MHTSTSLWINIRMRVS